MSFRTRRGVFSMHTESPITRPSTFACIQKTLQSVFSHVRPMYLYIQMYAVLWSITVASDGSDMASVGAATVDGRLKKSGIMNLKMYNGAVHKAFQVAYPFISDILKKPAKILTDKRPDVPDEILHH